MTFVHSFWSKPLLNSKFKKYEEMLPVMLSNYAYSALCVKRRGYKIKLFADKIGAEMLDFIDYDEVIILDNLDNESVHFAAQIKFEALKQMTLDECLIDGDLFLREKPIFDVIQSINTDFLYSFYEPYTFTLRIDGILQKYQSTTNIFLKHKDKFEYPYTITTANESYQWPNTSFMRISNQELKDEYIRQYEYHKNLLKDEEFTEWPDVLIEQQHMEKLVKSKGYSFRPLVFFFPSKTTNDYACMLGFCHLGAEKVKLKNLTYEWLKKENPQLFDAVFKQVEKYKEIPL